MSRQCSCKRGHVSAWDGKCGHCRTNREQRDHDFKLRHSLYKFKDETVHG